jgi:hypothetical protein
MVLALRSEEAVPTLAAFARFIASVFGMPTANPSSRKTPIGWGSVRSSAQRRYLQPSAF